MHVIEFPYIVYARPGIVSEPPRNQQARSRLEELLALIQKGQRLRILLAGPPASGKTFATAWFANELQETVPVLDELVGQISNDPDGSRLVVEALDNPARGRVFFAHTTRKEEIPEPILRRFDAVVEF